MGADKIPVCEKERCDKRPICKCCDHNKAAVVLWGSISLAASNCLFTFLQMLSVTNFVRAPGISGSDQVPGDPGHWPVWPPSTQQVSEVFINII